MSTSTKNNTENNHDQYHCKVDLKPTILDELLSILGLKFSSPDFSIDGEFLKFKYNDWMELRRSLNSENSYFIDGMIDLWCQM